MYLPLATWLSLFVVLALAADCRACDRPATVIKPNPRMISTHKND
jgi:hypothetical protein